MKKVNWMTVVLVIGLVAGLAIQASAATIVTPSNMMGWAPANVRSNGFVGIAETQPRSGNGSLEFRTTGGPDKADMENIWGCGVSGRTLSSLSALSFDWYRAGSSTAAAHLAPVLRLYVYDPGTHRFGLLIWEGIYNGVNPAPVDAWQTQDVLGGNFWMYVSGFGGGVVQNYDTTLQEWIDGSPTGQPGDPTPIPIAADTRVCGINVGVGSGWANAFTGFADNVIAAFGQDQVSANFEPDLPPSTITVHKYNDLDEDGERDEGEPPLENWYFTVSDETGVEVATGHTDANGQLVFHVDAGTYQVCETLPEGWVNTDPGNVCQSVILGADDVEPGPDEVTLSTGSSSFFIEFLGTSTDGLTWTYRVTELSGKDLSHWILGLCPAAYDSVVSWSPTVGPGIEGVELVDPDPTTGVSGIKWDLKDNFDPNCVDRDTREFSVTLDTLFPIGTTEVGIKTGGRGSKTATGFIAGPHCGAAPLEVSVVFGNYEETETAIKLDDFTFEPTARGISLVWTTGTSIDNAGFNLYRATSLTGPYVRVNDRLIVADADAVSGGSYSYEDVPGYGVFYYQLEDVDDQGQATLQETIQVQISSPFRRPLFRPVMPYSELRR